MQRMPAEHGGREPSALTDGGHNDSKSLGAISGSNSYRLLLPILNGTDNEANERSLRAATTIANSRAGELLIVNVVHVPEQTPYGAFQDDDALMQEAREHLEELVERANETIPTQGVVCLSHKEARAIIDLIERHDCDGTLVELSSEHSQRRRLLSGATVEKLVARAPSDVFVLKLAEEDRQPERILLGVSGGPHSGLAAETASALASVSGAAIDVVHFLGEDATEDEQTEGQRVLDAAGRVMKDVNFDTELATTESVSEEIIGRSKSYDITVLGSPTIGLLKQFIFGTVPDSVSRDVEEQVVMAKQKAEHEPSIFYRWLRDQDSESTGDEK